ncbi:catabolite repression protein creC [Myriangium duriaei CBS 260.36]|uniref:Catabolite repression protein creC n=1 Tax=Myriangium duriaei CBS 260.36 TaxID=1168546 RepID=A0A9P4MLR7_9PEZI|nr:catabolite repression protein creC [Myriangium duriaei CBS 260.36]
MFVLPPPPTYSASKLYPGGVPGGLIETHNHLNRYEGPEYQLVLGEGTYALRDELLLATPPPHPSDIPVPNNNPLATTIGLPTSGTKLSLAILAPRPRPSHGLYRLPTSASARSNFPAPSISEETRDSLTSDEGSNLKSNGTDPFSTTSTVVFGGDNPALALVNGEKGKDANKKKKPKNNIVKSNSSFVSRVIPFEGLQKRLADRNPEGIFAFANINRAVQWLDLSAENKADNLTKILFTKAHVLCHDINEQTKSASNLDIIFGYNTSDLIWYEPMSQKYSRINKNGHIHNPSIVDIHWIPHSDNLFIAAHMDGSLVVYDRDKEDASFVTEENLPEVDPHSSQHSISRMEIRKSVQSRNQKTNPVAFWKLGMSKINKIAFSPDGTYLAVVSEDGTLKIIDFLRETLLDVYRSYYGGLISVTWSPDGRYILTGGQDDLVSIWSFSDGALVARCQGHSSWVTDVKFDPWRCDERNYRFGSVGEDCRLLLWDFSVGMLGRPKTFSIRQRTSITSGIPPRKTSNSTTLSPKLTQDGSALEPTESNGIAHGVDPRANTAVLPPVMSKQVDDHPLSWLGFEEDCIITVCHDGHIRTWDRPED